MTPTRRRLLIDTARLLAGTVLIGVAFELTVRAPIAALLLFGVACAVLPTGETPAPPPPPDLGREPQTLAAIATVVDRYMTPLEATSDKAVRRRVKELEADVDHILRPVLFPESRYRTTSTAASGCVHTARGRMIV